MYPHHHACSCQQRRISRWCIVCIWILHHAAQVSVWYTLCCICWKSDRIHTSSMRLGCSSCHSTSKLSFPLGMNLTVILSRSRIQLERLLKYIPIFCILSLLLGHGCFWPWLEVEFRWQQVLNRMSFLLLCRFLHRCLKTRFLPSR